MRGISAFGQFIPVSPARPATGSRRRTFALLGSAAITGRSGVFGEFGADESPTATGPIPSVGPTPGPPVPSPSPPCGPDRCVTPHAGSVRRRSTRRRTRNGGRVAPAGRRPRTVDDRPRRRSDRIGPDRRRRPRRREGTGTWLRPPVPIGRSAGASGRENEVTRASAPGRRDRIARRRRRLAAFEHRHVSCTSSNS